MTHPACKQNEPDAAVEGNASAIVIHLLLGPVWMQQGECRALGKGVNGRKADFPVISSAEEECLCGFFIVFCGYSGFESASLNWNTVRSERNCRAS